MLDAEKSAKSREKDREVSLCRIVDIDVDVPDGLGSIRCKNFPMTVELKASP